MLKSLFPAGVLILGLLLLRDALNIQTVWDEPLGPAAYPTLLSILLVAGAVTNIVVDVVARFGKSKDSVPEATRAKPTAQAPVAVVVLAVLYVFAIRWLGFYSATFLFSLSMMSALGFFSRQPNLRRKIVLVILPSTVVMVLILYVTFESMRIYLPSGGLIG